MVDIGSRGGHQLAFRVLGRFGRPDVSTQVSAFCSA